MKYRVRCITGWSYKEIDAGKIAANTRTVEIEAASEREARVEAGKTVGRVVACETISE